jgi:hypothetical protein
MNWEFATHKRIATGSSDVLTADCVCGRLRMRNIARSRPCGLSKTLKAFWNFNETRLTNS